MIITMVSTHGLLAVYFCKLFSINKVHNSLGKLKPQLGVIWAKGKVRLSQLLLASTPYAVLEVEHTSFYSSVFNSIPLFSLLNEVWQQKFVSS